MFKIVYVLPFVAAVGFFALSIFVNPKTVVIQSFSVPNSIEERGYNPKVVKSLLKDYLEDIVSNAGTNRGNLISKNSAQATNIDALSDWFGFAKPIRASQIALGLLPYVFDAELLEDSGNLILRIDGQSKKYWGYDFELRRSDNNIRALISEAALELMSEIDPYVVAVYHFRDEIQLKDFTRTKAAIDYALVHAPSDQLNWVYALLAHVLFFEGEYEKSIEKNRQAFQMDRAFVRPLMRWGENLAKMGKHEEAIVQYRRLLDIEPTYPEALVYWGDSLIELGDIKGAGKKYQEAYEMNPEWARIVRAYGKFEAEHGDKKYAADLLREAVMLSDGFNDDKRYIDEFRDVQRALDPVFKMLMPQEREGVVSASPDDSLSNLE